MRISVILRKDRPDKEGRHKLLIRISDKAKKTYATTPYKLLPSQFKKGKVVNHPEAAEINAWLKNEISEIEEGATLQTSDTFESYANKFIDHCTGAGIRAKGTLRYYKGEVSKFLRFTTDLPLKSITPAVIKQYEVWMKKKGNLHNTVWKSRKFLKIIMRSALKEKLIRKNPFDDLEPFTYKQTERQHLTTKEVNKIRGLKIEESNPLYKVSRWFLIQCFTGLRAGDLPQLDFEKIKSMGRLVLTASKTGTVVSQPVSDELLQLMEEAGPFTITLENYNGQLKSLAIAANISKNLTSHVGRHTAAMRMAEKGISKEVAGKVLGHKKSATTDIYYKIQDKRVDEEMKGFSY